MKGKISGMLHHDLKLLLKKNHMKNIYIAIVNSSFIAVL